MVATDLTQALREENERLRAEVAYLKKLQALIRSTTRSRRPNVPTSKAPWRPRFAPSMTSTMAASSICFDNAAIESFFGTLKAEYFHLAMPELYALEAGVHDYINYYNHERIKLGLQGLSPVAFRLRRSTTRSAGP